jgi:hypothetical protein
MSDGHLVPVETLGGMLRPREVEWCRIRSSKQR